ncbi:MAG: hypothetical protein JNK21_08885 [Rhodospirillaceae bacterium]|nr:hypothetical protein [Rhodospirillaceae bacterium]
MVSNVKHGLLALALVFAVDVFGAAPSFAQTDDTVPPPGGTELGLPDTSIREQIENLPEADGALFGLVPETNSDIARPQANEPRLKRARAVTLSGDYVRTMLDATPLEVRADGRIPATTRQHLINLFDDQDVRLVKLKQYRDTLGNIVWRGGIIDDPMGSATIVFSNGEMTASIITKGRTFTVSPARNGQHLVRELQPRTSRELFDPAARRETDAKVPPEPEPGDVEAAPAEPIEKSQAESPETAQAGTTITVLITYTPKALTRIGNISAAASLAIADLNTTFVNSNIDAEAVLVGLEQVNYTEGTDDDQILDDATDRVGDFNRIHTVRAATRADLIAVLADYGTGSSCGLGWINTTLTQSNIATRARFGVSLTNALNCLPGTFTHEVGHNLGANHDRYVVDDDVPGPTGYNYGYIDTTARFMDVMAYSDQCQDLNITCTEIQYFSNPNVTYNGRPVGIADTLPTAANNARKIREMMVFVAQFGESLTQSSSPLLSVLLSGTGTITSSPSGINCGNTCSAKFTSGANVTLTATPTVGWQFAGWSGACTGTGTCTVTMNGAVNVTGTFEPGLRLGTVYASVQPTSQSFLRFVNTGTTANTVRVALANSATGQALGTWTSPSIAAGSALQVPITTVETALTPGTAKPQTFSAIVRSAMTGYIQHVLYRPADGTLTNLSTCDSGVTANSTQVANVHSTILDFGFPSSIALTNSGASSSTAVLGIFDANNGARLGTYTTASIPREGQLQIPISTIQSALNINPTSIQYHYVVKVENTFRGTLQHLVNNIQAGVITDMTTTCAFGTVAAAPSTVAIRQPGPIFSSSPGTSQSFLRFYNTGTTAGTVNVSLSNPSSGTVMGDWTSPTIQPGASAQYQITTPETTVTGTKPQFYSASLQAQMSGYFQHVLYRPADGTLTNLSTCEAGVTNEPGQLINVHSTLLDFGFPSSIVVTNGGSTAATAALGIYDALNGVKLGTYTTGVVQVGGQLVVPVATIQSALGITPNQSQFHYVIRMEGSFSGFLQHLVDNKSRGVITDMTTMCTLPASAIRYNTCFPTSCPISVGTAANGQLKRTGYYENFRVSLTAGQTYTIDIRGSSTNSGTLARPYIYIYSPTNSVVGQGGGGGTGNNARVTFTPTTTGNHVIQVTAYVYANNGGTFTITVN